MHRRGVYRRILLAGMVVLLVAAAEAIAQATKARADTPAFIVSGEGGDASTPVMLKLLKDDTAQVNSDSSSYNPVGIDNGIADFIGTAPNSFGADFAVSERPLTSAEAATAAANGRSYAYIPFAGLPVALLTLVPNGTYTGSQTILPDQYCQHMPLTLSELADMYGYEQGASLQSWNDPRLSCTTATPGGTPDGEPIALWANNDPTMENYALESLLDSTTASQATFQAGLTSTSSPLASRAVTTSTGPSEKWPYSEPTFPGGDEATLLHVLPLNSRTNAPTTVAADIQLGTILPIASVWTGDPEPVKWNLPTAAVQNAAGSFVAPTAASAAAAEADATLAQTTDPTTNNLVIFNASQSDTAAYNNNLMLESYLVVPTNGLSPDKALALAQFIRFALGGTGQKDIASLGAAPATSAMVKAGLLVARQLNELAATTTSTTAPSSCSNTSTTSTSSTTSTTSTTSTSTTTTVPCPAATTTTSAPSSTTTTSDGGTTTTTSAGGAQASAQTTGDDGSSPGSPAGSGPTTSSSATSSSGALAFTGLNPVPLFLLGGALLVFGEGARRWTRRRVRRA